MRVEPMAESFTEREPGSILATLAALRWFSVAAQAVAVAIVAFGFGVPLPLWSMAAAIAALAVFNVYATRRARRESEPAAVEVFAHIAADVAVLAFLIGCSGGPANPFTSLFLVPIAFAALALPRRWILATAALCGLGYALAAIFGRPLPHVHGLALDSFDLHLWGMAVNFVISAAVFAGFLARMARQRREREAELARLRERFARDEGIFALATHAASVAHELNTPLATMLLVLDELEASELPPGFGDDIALLRTLAETCRDRVRELARAARRGEEVDLEAVVSRWHLLRPAVALEREATLTDGVRVDAAVGHLLRVLLDNAADATADAGAAAGDARVRLGLRREEAWLVGWVRDRGPGLSPQQAFSTGLRGSGKPEGLGVGLALSRAALERLGGELRVETAAGEGTCVHFRVPLAATDAA